MQHSRNLIQLQIDENGKVYKNVITHIIRVPDDILRVAIFFTINDITFHNFNEITVDLTFSNEETALMPTYFYSVDRSRNFISKQQENK